MTPTFEPGVQRRQVSTERTDSFFRVATSNIPAPDTSPARRLGKSLGILEASALGEIDAFEKRKQEEAEQKAQIELETKGLEQVKKDRENGLYPADDRFLNRALDRQTGTQTAVDWGDNLIGRLNPGTEDSLDVSQIDDVEGFIRTSLSEQVQTLGDNKLAQGGFTDASSKQLDRVLHAFKQAKSQANVTQAADGVFEQFNDTIQAGVENGASPEDIANAVHSQYQDISDAMGFKPSDIDRIVVSLAGAQAEAGNYEVVKELLQSDRDGVGPIAGKRAFSAASIKILDAARAEDSKQREAAAFDYLTETDEKVSEGRYTEEDAEFQRANYPGVETDRQIRAKLKASDAARKRILKDQATEAQKAVLAQNYANEQARLKQVGVSSFLNGTLTQAPESFQSITEKGKPKDISYSTFRDDTVNTYVNEISPRIAQQNGESPEQTFSREIGAFSRAGVTNPQWERQLKAGFGAVNVASIGDKTIGENPAFLSSYQLYTDMFVKAPQLLQAHLPANSKESQFYEQVRALQQYAGYELADATQIVFNATKDPQAADSVSRAARRSEIAAIVADLDGNDGFIWDSNVQNKGEIGPRIEAIAQVYSAVLGPTEAVKIALEQVQRTHTVLNGYMIWTGGGVVPEGFKPMAEEHLETMAEEYGLDADDLTLQPLSNANKTWRIVDRATGAPPQGLDLEDTGAAFNVTALQSWYREAQENRIKEAKEGVALRREQIREHKAEAERFLSKTITTDLMGNPIGSSSAVDALEARNAQIKANAEEARKEELRQLQENPSGTFLGNPIGKPDEIL